MIPPCVGRRSFEQKSNTYVGEIPYFIDVAIGIAASGEQIIHIESLAAEMVTKPLMQRNFVWEKTPLRTVMRKQQMALGNLIYRKIGASSREVWDLMVGADRPLEEEIRMIEYCAATHPEYLNTKNRFLPALEIINLGFVPYGQDAVDHEWASVIYMDTSKILKLIPAV